MCGTTQYCRRAVVARPVGSEQLPGLFIPKPGLFLSEAAFSKDSVSSGFVWGWGTSTSYGTSSKHLAFSSLFMEFGPGQIGLPLLFWCMCQEDIQVDPFCVGARRIRVICPLFSMF